MSFPAAGTFVPGMPGGTLTDALEDLLAAAKDLPGAEDETELVIASGSVTATRPHHTLDTESDAASDDLTNVLVTSFDGFFLMLGIEDAARVVTAKHESGGAGQLSLLGGQDLVVAGVRQRLLFWIDRGASPVTLRELARWGFETPGEVLASTAGSGAPRVLTAEESGRTFTNEGASAQAYFTLPTARKGLRYRFVVQDADGIRAVAGAGDTIRNASNVSPAAGYVEATTIGNVIELVAINDTEWVAVSVVGTWTVST